MTEAAAPRQGKSRVKELGKSAIGIFVMLALTELLLRFGFGFYAKSAHPNCGLKPELMARLIRAYSMQRPPEGQGTPDGMVSDAHRGWKHAAGLKGVEQQGVPVSTNSRGARGAKDNAVPKPAGVLRVVTVGDSFTFGEGVPDDATWPAQLEAALGNVEVVNFGERAYAHDQMYYALKDDGMAMQPDVVIVGFYLHDLWRDELTFYCAEKPRFTQGSSGWDIENVPVPSPWDAYDRVKHMPLLYAVPRILVEAAAMPPPSPNDAQHGGEARATEILDRIRAMTEAAGARFVMVNLPDRPEVAPEMSGFFADYCKRAGAECVDSWPLFRPAAGSVDPQLLKARFQRPNDIHYSREGYAVVAEALKRHFAEHPISAAKTK